MIFALVAGERRDGSTAAAADLLSGAREAHDHGHPAALIAASLIDVNIEARNGFNANSRLLSHA